jgi:hypothetical protein
MIILPIGRKGDHKQSTRLTKYGSIALCNYFIPNAGDQTSVQKLPLAL